MCTERERGEEDVSSSCNCLTPCDDYCGSENHLSREKKLALIKWLVILVTTGRFIPEFFFLVWSKAGNDDPRPRAGKIKRMIGIVEWLNSTRGMLIFFGTVMVIVVASLFAVTELFPPQSISSGLGVISLYALTFVCGIVYAKLFAQFIRHPSNKNILAFVVWMWKLSRLGGLSLDQLVQLSEAGFHQVAESVMSQLVRGAQEKQRIMWNLGEMAEDGQVYVQAGTAVINAWEFAVNAYVLLKPFGIREQALLERKIALKNESTLSRT